MAGVGVLVWFGFWFGLGRFLAWLGLGLGWFLAWVLGLVWVWLGWGWSLGAVVLFGPVFGFGLRVSPSLFLGLPSSAS